jgi:hypothetical protein
VEWLKVKDLSSIPCTEEKKEDYVWGAEYDKPMKI